MRSLTADARRLLDALVNQAVIEVLNTKGDAYSSRAAGRALIRLTEHVRLDHPGAQDLLDALAANTLRAEISKAAKRESRPIGITHDGIVVKAPSHIGVRAEGGYQMMLWTDVTPAQFMAFLQGQRSTQQTLESNLVVYEAIGRRIADHMDADTVADALQRDGVDPAAFDLTA